MASDKQEFTHPSFGTVVISKASGLRRLFGSNVEHQHFITLKVYPAAIEQDVYGDRTYARKKPLIEIHMSEAQWAHMLSSFGLSEGTPVTIRSTETQGFIPEPPPLPSILDVQKRRTNEITQKLAERARNLGSKFKEMLTRPTVRKKDLEEMVMDMNVFAEHVTSNFDYLEEATIERMEKETAKARIEIEAMAQNILQRAGIKALNGKLSDASPQNTIEGSRLTVNEETNDTQGG